MKIAKIRIYRNRKPWRLPKIDISLNPPIIRAQQALTRVQERVDRLIGKQLDIDTRQRLSQVQIFIHEALMVIADD